MMSSSECKTESSKRNAQIQLIKDVLGPEEDVRCGFGALRGRLLQSFATPMTYLVISSAIALLQGIFYTYTYATISTIEKRYGLSSKLSGFTTIGNDVVQVCVAIPLPFWASKGHRPRILSFGMFLSGLGCLLAALPHFIIVPEEISVTTQDDDPSEYIACQEELSINQTSKECSSPSILSSVPLGSIFVVVILTLAQMMSSIGTLLYYTIGHSYLDESVSKEKVPFYYSISGGARYLGPVTAYSIASWSLRKWVYPSMTSSIKIKPSHPHWVGAWWIGYIMIGSLLLCLSWPLALLPRTLPGTRKRREKEIAILAEKEPDNLLAYLSTLRSRNQCTFQEMVRSLRRLLINPIFVLLNLNQCLYFFMFMGYLTFKSKYIEHQFKMSAAAANQYIAIVSLIATIIGWLGTGISLTYFKPKSKTVLLYMTLLTALTGVCHLTQMFIKCEQDKIEGLQEVLMRRKSTLAESLDGCHSATHFSPVCHNETSRAFFSACYAGCSQKLKSNGTFIYTNCSCIETRNESLTEEIELHDGYCSKHCPYFLLYLIVSVLSKMFNGAARVPVNVILFRCVEERDKDLGMGVLNVAISGLSYIPAPIFFGWAIDSLCILWSGSCGDSSGRCWVYDNDLFRTMIHGIPTAVLALCFLTNLWLLKYHKQLNLYSEKITYEWKASTKQEIANEEIRL